MDTKLPAPNPLERPLSHYCSKNNLEATLDISTFISLYSSLFLIKASGKDFKNKIHWLFRNLEKTVSAEFSPTTATLISGNVSNMKWRKVQKVDFVGCEAGFHSFFFRVITINGSVKWYQWSCFGLLSPSLKRPYIVGKCSKKTQCFTLRFQCNKVKNWTGLFLYLATCTNSILSIYEPYLCYSCLPNWTHRHYCHDL